MKKILSVVLALVLCTFTLLGCAKAPEEPVKLATLKGPTGMGMVSLMQEGEAGYNVTLSSAPDEVTAMLISGEADIAAVPVNLGSVLYNKLDGDVRIIAASTLGVLYVLSADNSVQSVSDLAGKTLYATGQAATPEYILNYILQQNGVADKVTVEYKAEHSELAALLAAGDVTLGMLPEPNVTAAMVKNPSLHIALDLTDEWSKITDASMVQSAIICRASYYEAHKAQVEQFLADYAASVAFVNEKPAEAAAQMEALGIVPAAAIGEKAIPNCNIVCLTGENMKASVSAMLDVLYTANPKSVGGAVPNEDFYVG
ncbi:MAG: ABC transporter substrate-binding protein [Eubacteriales bacterium]|nr:ABC transporter substrate-binding protein [Eubacteriales bacterium]